MANKKRQYFRIVVILLSFCIILFTSAAAKAGIFDPSVNWQTIRTAHFKINFPKDLEPLAKKSAAILEEVYPDVTSKWNWRPWGQTEVVLVDNTDSSNGMASVLPYNWMLIYAVPPPPDSALAHYDDWLKMLLVHEYTHVVQIDAYGGAWYPLRFIFQKTVAPSGINPTWLREGIAQYDETVLTEGGRGRGTYSEMIVRTSILEDTFPPIDVADGLSWKWPGYKAAYAYGVMFVHWLIDHYGEDKFREFDRRVRSSILIAMINHQARNVYGKTFYELWREWQQDMIHRYDEDCASIREAGITPYEVVVPVKRDEEYHSPTLSPDGKRLAYSVSSPHGPSQIRVKDLETGETEVLRKKNGAVQFSWSPDGTKLAYATTGSYKRYYAFYDLWLYDFNATSKKQRTTKLTKGARAKDPDFFPGGNSMVYVENEAGTDVLKRYDFTTKESVTLTSGVSPFTQFANPRVSKDGRYIAVSMWKSGDGWRIYKYNSDGTQPKRLTKGDGLVIESRPVWTPDGEYVVYTSDETGISNIYRVKSSGGNQERLTNVLTGVFQPTFVHGSSVIAERYNSKGFEIASFVVYPLEKSDGLKKSEKKKGQAGGLGNGYQDSKSGNLSGIELEGAGSKQQVSPFNNDQDFKSGNYVAFGKSLFLPRFILPNAAYADDAVFASLLTGGMDVLRWHRWVAAVTYRTDANYFGYSFNYTYNRFRPAIGLGFLDYAVNFGQVLFGATGRQVHLFEKRRGAYTYFAIPIQRHSLSLGYYYEDHMSKTALQPAENASLNLGKFAGLRVSYRYGDAEEYPASISLENGRKILLHTTVTNKIFGSGDRNEQTIFAGDWREYVKLFRHNVLALRAGGGMTWGDRLVQGTFGMGGAVGEGTLAGGGSYTYFPFRGLPVSALSRTRAMLFSAEYRFPIIHPLRGLGTVPVFLKDISGSIFTDYGNAWDAHEGGCDKFSTFFDQFLMSVGAEISGDFYIGHGLPLHGRVGYAIVLINRDRLAGLSDPILGSSVKNGMLILSLGTSF